jgi:hypothetical protein
LRKAATSPALARIISTPSRPSTPRQIGLNGSNGNGNTNHHGGHDEESSARSLDRARSLLTTPDHVAASAKWQEEKDALQAFISEAQVLQHITLISRFEALISY